EIGISPTSLASGPAAGSITKGVPKKPSICGHASGILIRCSLVVRTGADGSPGITQPQGKNPSPRWGAERASSRASARLVLPMTDVPRILSDLEHGDPHAAEQLLPLVYEELRQLAAQRLAQEQPGQTLQATALVHEAYLRLVDV